MREPSAEQLVKSPLPLALGFMTKIQRQIAARFRREVATVRDREDVALLNPTEEEMAVKFMRIARNNFPRFQRIPPLAPPYERRFAPTIRQPQFLDVCGPAVDGDTA